MQSWPVQSRDCSRLAFLLVPCLRDPLPEHVARQLLPNPAGWHGDCHEIGTDWAHGCLEATGNWDLAQVLVLFVHDMVKLGSQ